MTNSFPVALTGRVGTDPNFTIAADTERVTFRLAVDTRRPTDTGAWETVDTVWHDVVAFSHMAEQINRQVRKGDAVLVLGDLRFHTYETREGQRRTRSEVVARAVGPDLRLETVAVDRQGRTRNPTTAITAPVQAPRQGPMLPTPPIPDRRASVRPAASAVPIANHSNTPPNPSI
ncbi:single-stranded DNA-binding protein [Phytoactinopolyspora alkaliphila]|uniref:Single-stranded DNA-binding protein n=1 Tax=Phytoactinopolyspora alkaliphila TaxID=1783498 RepID=A0A6N9YPB8_9ACTN|nr:single-stranded DNA-binding protein [Phytoactinopolyspora alkaliphila]